MFVAGSAVAYLIVSPPSDFIRETIAGQVKAKTGRDLVVAGPASVTFWPGVGVRLEDVSLSGPVGSDAALVKMAALDVSVQALPLLSREIAVDRIVLTRPVFDLRIDKGGRKNWDFAGAAPRVRYAEAAGGPVSDAGSAPSRRLPERLAKIKSLQLDDVRIEDGVLRFADERSGASQQIDGVNVKVSAPALESPVAASGDFAWRGEKTVFEGRLTNSRLVIEEKPAVLAFSASNARFAANYNGNVLVTDRAELDGQITLTSQSARALAEWLGTNLPPVSGFGPLSVTGELATSGPVTKLRNATFGLDGATARGAVTLTRGETRPTATADLEIDELDLNKYLIAAAAAPGGDAPAPQPKTEATDPIEELLNAPSTKVYGSTQRAGWSSEPFNLALLSVADVDAKLALRTLKFRDLTVGRTSATAALKDRVLKTQFIDIQLYEGHGRGALNVDGTGAGIGIGGAFALEGVQAATFLQDAAKISWLSGKTKLDLQVTAAGANQLELVEGLNGSAGLTFADGAIAGFNLPGFIRNLSQGQFSGLKTAPSEKTDFSQLTAAFVISKGVAQNTDLQFVSPLLRVGGAGSINLPLRTIDYMLKPKIVASLEGQQGDTALSGIEVPVRISGPWEKPQIEPELKGVIANPEKAVETVKELGKQYKGKSAGEIVDDLFKKDEKGSSKAKDLLKKFLKPEAEAQP